MASLLERDDFTPQWTIATVENREKEIHTHDRDSWLRSSGGSVMKHMNDSAMATNVFAPQ